MEHLDEPTTAELLAEADALHGSLGAALSAISRSASEDAVTVTVDLHGKLTGLAFTAQAMLLRPAELAVRISRATTEAAAAALADGMQVLTENCGELVAEAVAEHTARIAQPQEAEPAPAVATSTVDDEEAEFAPRSWAIAWDAG